MMFIVFDTCMSFLSFMHSERTRRSQMRIIQDDSLMALKDRTTMNTQGSALQEDVSNVSSQGDDVDYFEGQPCAVLKTRRLDGTKVFINICVHDSIPTMAVVIGLDCPRDIPDKSGETCLGFDACVNSEVLCDEGSRNEVGSVYIYVCS